VAAVWTAVVGGSVLWTEKLRERELLEIAMATAQAQFDRGNLYRMWNASHGGIYVRLGEGENPSSFIPNDHPARELRTQSGERLGLIPPILMTQQVHALGERIIGNAGRGTSLAPQNPDSQPDAWEAQALRRLEAGEQEVSSLETVDGTERLRVMRSFVATENCLPCHSDLGQSIGRVQGGISQNVNMEPLRQAAAGTRNMSLIGHGFLWILGLGGIVFGRQRLEVQVERRERAEARIRHLANHDELTALPNRNLFFERLKRSIARTNRSGLRTALMFVDLDGFKEINDTLGHDAGDNLLVEIAQRLLGTVREIDTVARIGGDEFAIILSDLPNMDVVARIANQMLVDLNQPFRLPQDDVKIGASIGVSFYPDDGESSEELLRAADMAMYEVKNLGKNGFSFVSGEMTGFAPEKPNGVKKRT
jgi:diguanylate cyclase (GGDEF)-like protein